MSEFKPAICIATYGDDKWVDLAKERALPSAMNQTVKCEVSYVHAGTLTDARNGAASASEGNQLIFLDADDELDPGYVEAMGEAHEKDELLLYQPATLGVVNGKEDPEPVLIPRRPLDTGNFMVIGTMVERSVFDEVGGFRDWPMYEDWELYIRCHKAGCGFLAVQDAVYRVHVSQVSRNNQSRDLQVKTFNEIRSLYY